MTLNDTQTQTIINYLAGLSLPANTQEELLDHLCCQVEHVLDQGVPFEAAWATTQERWNEDEVQKINSSNQNSLRMFKLMALGLITAVVGLFSLDPATAVPAVDTACDFTIEVPFRLDPPSTSPLANATRLTAGYGPAKHPITKLDRFHQGVDFKASSGTPVLAAGAGEVLEAGPKGKYGNCVIIVHDEIYQTLYAHLESINVSTGDYLTAGQTLGTVGSTGVSTGPHLHYEVIKNGERVNPANYLP